MRQRFYVDPTSGAQLGTHLGPPGSLPSHLAEAVPVDAPPPHGHAVWDAVAETWTGDPPAPPVDETALERRALIELQEEDAPGFKARLADKVEQLRRRA